MNANGAVPRPVLDQFTSTSSWFWTYGLEPAATALAWAQDNGKEFVPLINLKRVLPKTHPNWRCSFSAGTCTVDDIVGVLERTKSKISTKYLMGYNEPYASHSDSHVYASKGKKGSSGTEGAEWWRLYVQPAAQRTGLKLVSPTTGISGQTVGWMIEFLQACYDNKAADPPCNVELIEVFSVRECKCYENYWRKYAASDGGDAIKVLHNGCAEKFRPSKETNIYTSLKTAMREKYGDAEASSFWDPYFDSVELWVTETSCSGDLKFDKFNKNVKGLPRTPTAQQSCLAITGQSCNHGDGSVAAMLGLDSIERFSCPLPKSAPGASKL